MRSLSLPLLLLLTLALPATAADLTLSFPLGPHYRPGKYLPLHVTATLPTPATLTVADPSSPAARTTLRAPEGRLDLILPLFAPAARLTRPTLSTDHDDSTPAPTDLKPLADTDRLVAWTTPDEPFARHLLPPGTNLIPIPLDPANPLPGHPAAWEALDLLLLDPASTPRLTEPQLATLLACGVTVAARTKSPPFPAWPWKHDGDYYLLTPTPAGPATAAFFDDAYLPVGDWLPGRPWPARRQILVVAALCCLPLLALALFRPPLAPLWTLLTVAVICLALVLWQRTLLAPRQATGEIVILHENHLTQTDRWTYQTTPAPRVATLPWQTLTHPVASPDLPITLTCDPAGQPTTFTATLPANRKLAYLSRSVTDHTPTSPPTHPITSPLLPLVQSTYTTPTTHPLGQLPTTPGQWPPVLLDNRPR